MVRAPCCESMGLKKGPWTREEDHILINYINMYGHGNWRALPKLAGLLRCGKSCRLRWTNYLRPDIKRGNFSTEEEETIIQLHEALGNRWSAIAARLTGRTDNEIKNVWHTHLKKRVNEAENKCLVSNFQQETHGFKKEEIDQSSPSSSSKPFNGRDDQANCSHLNSPQHSYSDISSVVTNDNGDIKVMGNSQETDEDFWTEIFSSETSRQFTMSEEEYKYKSSMNDDMQFWFNVFTGGDELSEI